MTSALRLIPYTPAYKGRWNALVKASKNGTFLFDRDYMEYHADRFEDGSLLALEGSGDSNIVALLPANFAKHESGNQLISHGGLTYGGFVTDSRMTVPQMIELFDLLLDYCRGQNICKIHYKVMPRCFHKLPAEEDLYALFVKEGRLVRQDVGSVILLRQKLAWSKGKKQNLAKAHEAGMAVSPSNDFDSFIGLVSDVLGRHNAKPVHTADELKLLAGRFPQNIQLYTATLKGELAAAILVYDCGQTIHTQYMASNEIGRANGALEAIVEHLLNVYADRDYLSFGISTEQAGRVLNHGLIGQKEMFGARAMVHSFYDLVP